MNTIETQIRLFLTSCQSVLETGQATEHSYRKSLEILLSSLDPKLSVLNEPKRQKVGAPDFILFRGSVQIGFLEAKDIPENLNDKKFHDQLSRYQALGNLCFTNNLDWRFYDGITLLGEVKIANLANGKIVIIPENLPLLESHLREFVARKSLSIKSSKQLAVVMAGKAKTMRDIIVRILELDQDKSQNSVIFSEYEAFKDLLIHDLSINKFADIYSQTITYGLFTARFYDTSLETFSRAEAANNLPKSNPFLRKLFDNIAGIDLDERFAWVVDNLVDAFAHSDVKSLMNDFGKATAMSDPVLHFYETFLGEYDPKSRKSTGVYYTPDPVVKFIVKSVDEILQKDFNLPMGLADNSKIQREITKDQAISQLNSRTETKANNHKKYFEDYHRVQILDPATGTGTFLLEVFKQIHSKYTNMAGIWQSYAQKDLLPRVHGFELLMASYSMAHLKLSMYLATTGVRLKDTDRLSVYLTNSLEEGETVRRDIFSKWLNDESHQASKIKNNNPVMVIIGNPPYSVSSSNKSNWIEALIQDYKKGLNEKNIQPLSDDYIKFIRFGHHFVSKNQEGILAYISNNSFLEGIIHRKMREELLKEFDSIYIIDLHGNSKKKEVSPDGSKDENVFDIQQGVSINIFVKTGKKKTGDLAKIFHFDIFGKREAKYETLRDNTVKTLQFTELKPDDKYHFFVPKDFGEQLEYEKGIKLNELFSQYSAGLETGDDKQKVNFIKSLNNQIPIQYKPFDTRYLIYDVNKLRRPSYDIMKNYINKLNFGFIMRRTAENTVDWQQIFITKFISDANTLSARTSTFPLYIYPDDSDYNLLQESHKPKPNFDKVLIKQIEGQLGMVLDWEAGIEDSYRETQGEVFSPVDLLDYIYAALHSPSYRVKYKEFLKIDFPRVSFNVKQDKFWAMVQIGKTLRQLHLMEGVNPTHLTTSYPMAGNNIVDKIEYRDNQVFINSSQYFGNVPSGVWEFYIGGYQPAQKWLKDRKNKELDYNEIIHYQKIIYVLSKTRELMKLI